MIAGSAFGTANESWMLGRAQKTLDYYSFASPLWIPIACAAIILLSLSYYIKGKLSQNNLLLILFFASVIQLFLSARTWFPSIDTAQFPIYPRTAITTFLQQHVDGRYTTWRDPYRDPYLLAENAPNVYHLYDMHGYEVCSTPSMSIFREHNFPFDSLDFRLLGLANIRYVLTRKFTVTTPYLRPLYSADSMTVYENRLAKPRAYFVYKSKIVGSDKEVTAELLRPDFDGSEALFMKDDAPENLGDYSESTNAIHIEKSAPEEIEVSAETNSKGILILTDSYYPGWKCYINGVEKPVYRVNYFMRAVPVDAGKSKIVFRFEPSIFTKASFLNGFAVLFVLVGIIRLKRKEP